MPLTDVIVRSVVDLAVPEVICRRRSFSANSAAEKSRIPAVDSTKTRLGPVVEWSEEEEGVSTKGCGEVLLTLLFMFQ